MFEMALYSVIAISFLALVAVAHKYHIDTRGTIAELSKDRTLYQKMAWQEIEAREKFIKNHNSVSLEQESIIRHIIGQSSDLKSLIESSDVDSKLRKAMLQKLDFVSMYSGILDQKNVNNLSSPIVKKF
jgi:hypothetical protein